MRRYAALLTLTLASVAGAQQGAAPAASHGAHHDGSPAAAAARPASVSHPARYSGKVLTVTALDYAFQAPDTVEAGYTTIRLLARGKELHHVQLARLEDGHTLKDLFAAMQASGGKPPAWFVEVGGPNAPVPGGESAASLELAPGRYVLLCFIPSPDGKPHVMKGMAKELTVVAPKGKVAKAAVKAPATTVTLTDYAFTFSKPLVAGTQTLRLVNAAEQHHELFIARLAPGKTAMELAQWAEKAEGPPPGMPIGGITGMDKGKYNDITLTLEPGEYALICFLPDVKDGKPHLVYGMITQVTVAPRVAKQ